MIKNILESSKLCYGPMSKNIVDSLIDFSNNTGTPITLIPSRRQIEWNGGYVNNWTTECFANYVKEKSKYIAIQRDHGGPGQGLIDDDGYESLRHDCKYFDAIHIDPWKKYQNLAEGIQWTLDMILFCYNLNSNLYFEVGTEEAIRPFITEEIDTLLNTLQLKLPAEVFNRIIFCVIQSGTALQNGENIGKYSSTKLKEMIKTVNKYNMLTKEHNGDYMDIDIMLDRFNTGLTSLNIAPEIGVFETKIIMNKFANEQNDKFYEICLNSNKWVKWVGPDFIPNENKKQLVEICGHYQFSNEEFLKLKINISNLDTEIKSKINNYLLEIFNKLPNNSLL